MNTKPWVCSLPGLKLAKEFLQRMFSYGPMAPFFGREGACLPNWVNTGRRRTTCCNILPPTWMVKGSYLYLFGQVQLQEQIKTSTSSHSPDVLGLQRKCNVYFSWDTHERRLAPSGRPKKHAWSVNGIKPLESTCDANHLFQTLTGRGEHCNE